MKLLAGQVYGLCEALLELMEKELTAKSALKVAQTFQTLNDKYRTIAQVVNTKPKDENGCPQKEAFDEIMRQSIEVEIEPLDESIFDEITTIKPKIVYVLRPILKKGR